MSSTTSIPPRASLLGLPIELRNQIYEHIFISPHDKTSLFYDNVSWHFRFKLGWDYYSNRSTYHDDHPLRRLHVIKRHSSTGPYYNSSLVLMGSDSGYKDNYQHFAALFSIPCVCRTIRSEVMPVLADLPPISQVRFVYQDFTATDMASWLSMLGGRNVARMRKWVLHGTRECNNEEYRGGHLWRGCRGGPAPCSYHTDKRKVCNRRCLEGSQERKGRCPRRVEVELDRRLVGEDSSVVKISSGLDEVNLSADWAETHEDGYCTPGCQARDQPAFWPSRQVLIEQNPPTQSSSADEVVSSVKTRLSQNPKAMRDALILTRHVLIDRCPNNYHGPHAHCTDEGVVDCLVNTTGAIEISKTGLVAMIDRL